MDAVDAINDLYTWRENVSTKFTSVDQRIQKLEDRRKLETQKVRSGGW